MAKVICSLKNASASINGVKFEAHKDGRISEEISDEAAARFASIPGYKLAGEKAAAAAKKDDGKKSAEVVVPAEPVVAEVPEGDKK